MLHCLETYCDINAVEQSELIIKIGGLLQKNTGLQIVGLSRLSYMITGFKQLLQEEIDMETFMTLGDITSKNLVTMPLLPHEACSTIDAGITLNDKQYDNALVLIDTDALGFASSDRQAATEKKLQAMGSRLFCL